MLQLSIHPNCHYTGIDRFHIRAVLPVSVTNTILAAIPTGRIAGLEMTVYDFETTAAGELVWASFHIDGVGITATPFQEGLRIDLNAEKIAEGDDRLDYAAFLEEHDGALPENFWIEPARILRALLGATKH
jgi:hypothetical protein